MALAFSSGNSRALAHLSKHSSWNMVSFSELWTLNPSGWHKQTGVGLMIDSSNLSVLPQEPSALLAGDFSYTHHHLDWGKYPQRFAFQEKISTSLLSWHKFIPTLTSVTAFEDFRKKAQFIENSLWCLVKPSIEKIPHFSFVKRCLLSFIWWCAIF